MADKKTTSFKVFIIVIALNGLSLLAAILSSFYHVDMKYSMIISFPVLIAFTLTTVGVYTGIKYQAESSNSKFFNRIGLCGNSLIFIAVVALMVFAALTKGNTQQDRLVGKWERFGDPYEGLQVDVRKVDDKYVGELVHTTDTAIYFGLELQDVKWKDLRKVNDTVYEFEDLRKRHISGKIYLQYTDAYLRFISNDTVLITHKGMGDEMFGSKQTWVKTAL